MFEQVLSESVAKTLYFSGNEDVYETDYFIDKMDKLFDMLNVSSFCQGKHNRKPFQDLIRGPGEFRMKVRAIPPEINTNTPMIYFKEILGYLNQWKQSVDKRKGPFSAAERRQMMPSDVTLNGIRITGMGLILMCLLNLLYIYSALSIGIDTIPIFYSWCNLLFMSQSADTPLISNNKHPNFNMENDSVN